jgi:hypothetical protein
MEGGRRWRATVWEVFDDVLELDWPCPSGHPWGSVPAKGSDLAPILQAVCQTDARTESGLLLRSVVAQIQDLLSRNPTRPFCATRLRSKIQYYFRLYRPISSP